MSDPGRVVFNFRENEPPVIFDLAKVKSIAGVSDSCWPVQIQLSQLMNSKSNQRSLDDARRYACAWCPTPGAPGHDSVTSPKHCPIASLVSPAGSAQLRQARSE